MTNLTILSKKIRTTNELYSLNDLHKASGNLNKHRPKYWLANEQTKDLIDEIAKGGIPPLSVKHGGTNSGTWVCKELVYAYAMWISAKFHLQVIRAFDAMAQQNAPIPTDMMIMDENTFLSFSQEQAGFLRTILRLSEKLERREKDTYLKIREMKKLLSMTKTLCAELESEVTTFEQQIVSDQNVISHIHLYRSLILKGENSQALRSYLNMPY